MADYRDFKEIAHSGGKMSFSLNADAQGRISIASGWSHSAPTPAAIVGLYAHLQSGAVITHFRIGGIGQPFDPQPPAGTIPVMLGFDSHARWGHRCPRCGGYFRSGQYAIIYPITCAYCGLRAPTHTFLTVAQRRYVAHAAEQVAVAVEELKPNEEREVVIDMDATADREAKEPKPEFYYSEEAQQTEFNCVKCGGYNDVRGRFAYCSACGWRNNGEDLKSKYNGIRAALNAGTLAPASAVRDAVSEYDACGRDFANQVQKRIPMKPSRKARLDRAFHDIDGATITAMKEAADIDLMRGFDEENRNFVRLMMHRRHVHEHKGGVADEIYVRDSGDTNARVGDLLREEKGNAHRMMNLLSKMVANLEADFQEIFPLTDWPVSNFAERKKLADARRKDLESKRHQAQAKLVES